MKVALIYCFATLLVTLPRTGIADESWIKVIDQNNAPVSNAIVSFASKKEKLITSKSHVMSQINMQFSPQVLVVPKGQTVLFPNNDNTRHHVYSFSKAKTFEIKLYKGLPTEPLLFDEEGMVVLGCNIHDSMVGYIYVSNHEAAAVSNTEGKVKFSETLPQKVRIWHANSKQDSKIDMTFTLQKSEESNLWIAQIELDQPPTATTNTFKSRFKR